MVSRAQNVGNKQGRFQTIINSSTFKQQTSHTSRTSSTSSILPCYLQIYKGNSRVVVLQKRGAGSGRSLSKSGTTLPSVPRPVQMPTSNIDTTTSFEEQQRENRNDQNIAENSKSTSENGGVQKMKSAWDKRPIITPDPKPSKLSKSEFPTIGQKVPSKQKNFIIEN